MPITEIGQWSNSTLTERGRRVFAEITERGQMAFGVSQVITPQQPVRVGLPTAIKLNLLKNKGVTTMFSYGDGYLGSNNLLTSVANQEVIPSTPLDWTNGYHLYKFSFKNDQACQVIINNETTLYLRANEGFNIELGDKEIFSFKIVQADITFNWHGAY